MSSLLVVFVFIVAGAALAANLVATARVLRCRISSTTQKIGQLCVVWLLPILGAVVAILMTRERLEPGTGRYSERMEELDEVAVSKPNYEDAD